MDGFWDVVAGTVASEFSDLPDLEQISGGSGNTAGINQRAFSHQSPASRS